MRTGDGGFALEYGAGVMVKVVAAGSDDWGKGRGVAITREGTTMVMRKALKLLLWPLSISGEESRAVVVLAIISKKEEQKTLTHFLRVFFLSPYTSNSVKVANEH